MKQCNIEKLEKMINPVLPSKMQDFVEGLRHLNQPMDEGFIINTMVHEGIVPATDHPLHQSMVLKLAVNFLESGFPETGIYLLEELLKLQGLEKVFYDKVVEIRARYKGI